MAKKTKRLTSAIILACMLVGMISPQIVQAEGEDQSTEEEAQIEDLQIESSGSGDEKTEEESVESKISISAAEEESDSADIEAETKKAETTVDVEDEETGEAGTSDKTENGLIEKNPHELNYLLIMSPYLETPGTQQILASYGDGTEQVEEMTLDLQDSKGNLEVLQLSKNVGTIFIFEKTFSDDNETGTYVITQIHVKDDSGSQTIVLSDLGMDARFGVNEEYDGINELVPLDEETEDESEGAVTATIASVDGDGEEAVDEVVSALENAENEVSDLASIPQTLASSSSNVVVAIDPGHDKTHAGATGSGLKEEELTLKIANYCKEELETYNGVSVYMTRTSASCPYPSTSSSGADIKKRVEASVAAGAKYYVSIHINDASSSSANGAEVIIPNSNWKPEIASEGKALAEAILAEIKSAGMNLRSTSIYSKDSTDGSTYADGSKADYYSVQHNCKLNGIPGIIVEHGFISNSSDVSNFLGSDSGLKKLGVADATGIANYLGLSKGNMPTLKSATADASGTTISWDSVSSAKGYAVYRKASGGSWSMLGTTTSTSYTDKASLTSGSTYYYTVRAFLGSESEAMEHKYDTDYWTDYDTTGLKTVYLSTPSLSSATTNASDTTISWGKVSGASGYAVYRKLSGGDWSLLTTTTSTSYKDTASLTSGKTYYYTIRAYCGDATTAKNNRYNAAYWGGFDTTGLKAMYLNTPTLSSATAEASGTKVSWKSVSGASGYMIYRKLSGGSWEILDTTTSTSYTDKTSLTGGKTYYYTLRAYYGDVTTAKDNRYNAAYWSGYDTTGLKAVYLSVPSLSKATTNASDTTISWGKVSGANGYAVYRKLSGGDWSLLTTTTSTSYTDKTSLTGGKTYYYTVRAYYGDVTTAKSNRYNAAYWGGFDTTGLKAVYLSTPTLSSATAEASGTKVSWKSVSGASGYMVFRKLSGGSWSIVDTTTSTSYTDKTSLTGGKTYYYTVRAYYGDVTTAKNNRYNAAYWGGYDTTGLNAVYLSTPTLSSATAEASGTKVSWKSVSGASGYMVYRMLSGGSWEILDTTTSTSYTDKTSLTGGKTYYYTVRAYYGNVTTAKNNRYNAAYWGGYDTTGIKSIYLSTPSLSSPTAEASGTKVSWKSVSGASGYMIYRKLSGGSWEILDTTSSTSYTDKTSLTGGKTYYYTVRAYYGDATTAKNNRYNAAYWSGYDTTGVKSVYLATPKLESASSVSNGVKVSWNSVSSASGYAVYRRKSGGDWSLLTTTTSTSYTDTSSLSSGTTYDYTVRAYYGNVTTAKNNRYNAAYWGGYDTSGVSIKISNLATPTLSGTTVVNDGIQVSWKSVSGASGYAVYRKVSGGSWSMLGTTTSTSYTDTNGGSSGTIYYYTVRAYTGSKDTALANKYSESYWSSYNSSGVSGSAYEIEGTTTVTVNQMVKYFNAAGKTYPSVYASKGASTITDMAQIYYDEAKAEGIKAEVAWCQMILETGYLQFGGRVSAEQCNFAGIGATDSTTGGGATFTSVREGVRAQIQHLKAYANSSITESKLAYDCVDPRFSLVSKGCAKYVEILGAKENPTGNGWATGKGYGTDIVNMIMDLKSM